MHQQCDICVIGNGAVGKIAALGLAQAGLDVTLLRPVSSQPAEPTKAGWDVRVYALNHVAHDLLASLKVWDALDASRIAPVDAMVVNGDGGAHAGHLAFDAFAARVESLAWIVEDANLNQALDTALKFTPNITLLDATAAALSVDAAHATVKMSNGDTLAAHLVIGADGSQSWVRGQCDIDIAYRAYGQRAIVTNFSCARPHNGVAYQWFSATEGVIALLPLPGQRVSLVWSAPEALAQTLLREPLTALAHRLSIYSAESLGALTPLEPEAVKGLPLVFLRPQAITAARVALVGDAAHVVHPLAGQGMNLGFSDVAALIAAIVGREKQSDCGDARVLARYSRSRKEEILLMQIATDGLNRVFSADFEPLRMARNLGMNLVDKFPFLKRHLIAQALGKRP
jgi:2-octaprenylphenol hydroxylase